MLILAEDANFKQKAWLWSGKTDNDALGPGWGTFMSNKPYLDYISQFANQDEVSSASLNWIQLIIWQSDLALHWFCHSMVSKYKMVKRVACHQNWCCKLCLPCSLSTKWHGWPTNWGTVSTNQCSFKNMQKTHYFQATLTWIIYFFRASSVLPCQGLLSHMILPVSGGQTSTIAWILPGCPQISALPPPLL